MSAFCIDSPLPNLALLVKIAYQMPSEETRGVSSCFELHYPKLGFDVLHQTSRDVQQQKRNLPIARLQIGLLQLT